MNKIFLIAITSIFSLTALAQEKRKEQKPPTIAELFAQMDKNKDAKLSKKEVQGPLKDDFDKIDTNKDGFLTKEELEKGPKPDRPSPPRKEK